MDRCSGEKGWLCEAGYNWQDKPGPSPDFWGGGSSHLPGVSFPPLQVRAAWRLVRQCSTRWGSELSPELHDFMVMSQPQTILWVVHEINRIKNTTGFYRVDELVSLLQLYTVGGPNLTSVSGTGMFSGTWQSLQHTNLLHSFLFLSQSLTSLLTQTKRTWKILKLAMTEWLTFIALEITETIRKLGFTVNVKTDS